MPGIISAATKGSVMGARINWTPCQLCGIRGIRVSDVDQQPFRYCVECAREQDTLRPGEHDPEPVGFSEFWRIVAGVSTFQETPEGYSI
jgi:hypothetical protein